MIQRQHSLIVLLLSLMACGDDLPDGVLGTTAQSNSSSGGEDGEDIDGTATADETGDPEQPGADGAPCDFAGEIGANYDFEPPAAEQVTLNGLNDCDFENILENDPSHLSDDDDFDIWIYHPQEDSNWPQGEFPVVFMSPGGTQQVYISGFPGHRYLPMFEALARAGFVVIAIDPEDTDWSSGQRRAALACAMIWARDDTEVSPHLADAMTILGHSRGGGAAWLLTRDILAETNLPPDTPITAIDGWSQCATVTLAQSFDAASNQDPTITNLPIDAPAAPPFLAIQGSIDEDTTNQQISAFDNRYSEAFIDAQTSEPDQNDELFLLVYGRGHNSWGGTNGGIDTLITPYYVPEFLRWQVLGEQERRAMLVAPMAWDADSSSFPAEIATSPTWTSADTDIFYSGCEGTPESPCPVDQAPLQGLGRPLIHASYTQGVTWNGANRFALDLLEEGQTGSYCEDFGTTGTDLPLSTFGSYVVPEATPAGTDPSVCEGPASSLLTGIGDSTFDGHDTGAMLVEWGGALGGASVRWGLFSELGMVPSEIATATHLSFRIGNVLTDDTASCNTLLDEVTMRVELRDSNLDGPGPMVTVTPIIDPQSQFGSGPVTGNLCRAAQFMHTVRIPMQDFCGQAPVSINNLTELVFHFDDDDETHVAMLDSLEFTHDPFLPGQPTDAGECPQMSASWNCEATTDLTVIETSCTTEPASGACPSMSQTTNSVALPTVPSGVTPYSGWIAHTPAGWISDPENPTQADLDRVLERCVEACELEWSNNPNVTAACSATDAFETPTLRQSPALGSEHRIPEDARDGSSLFTSQSLTCDLERDCCTAFDEDLCPSKPFRPTSVDLPLGRGEEVLVNVGTISSKATFITPGGSVSMPLVGEAGYSRCRDGGTCPFYVGSLAVTGASPVTVSDTCPDSSAFSAVVSDFDLELLQPAFGIADSGSNEKAFPAGALHLRGTITIAGMAYTIRAVNEQPVYLLASGSGFFAADLDIDLDVPCGAGTMPVTLQLDLRHDGTPIGRPPTIGITTPSTFSCPTVMTLTSTASDPDSDLASVRWTVDDVLIAPSVTTLPMTGPHTLRAVARDARGAATTATKSVSCL